MTRDPHLKQHFEILGLDKVVTLEKIRKAYRRKAFEYHPDRNKSSQANWQFVRVSQAYEFLVANYDELKTSWERGDHIQAETEQYQEFERNREQAWQEAMDHARRNYDQFRMRNADYKQRWHYIPIKILAYFVFVVIIMIGLALIIGPLVALIYSGNLTLIILYVPLLILGGLAFYYAFLYKIRIDPYFY